ncbi:MAG TPA: hypothetical protein VGK32_19990 [Vicinamibacterales bacterium]|jgi:hypothetical protein
MRLITRVLVFLSVVAVVFGASSASAQYRKAPINEPATGETYHVEFGVGLISPTPEMLVSSESLGIIGDQIDGVNDLGMSKTTFKEFRLVLRPFKKHKFRFGYIPINYSAEAILKRRIVFNGIAYNVGMPVNSSLDWKAMRFGYEYDFIYRDRGFVGLILEAKYTDVEVNLASPVDSEYARVRAPIPTIGGIVRVYPVANVAITGEVTGFKLPTSVDKANRYDGRYVDFDIYGTLNFTNNVGVQGGYRSLDVSYRVKTDTGSFKLSGPYIMGVARF